MIALYITLWICGIIASTISSGLHDERIAKNPGKTPRIGFWERLWYGLACIAGWAAIDTMWP